MSNNYSTNTNNYRTRYGFRDDVVPFYSIPPGLSEKVVQEISYLKNEPYWMLQNRLHALQIFKAKTMPTWAPDLSALNFDKIQYYIKPTEREAQKWSEVPTKIKNTFNKLGVPQAEREFLAGVGAQYESETIYHNLKTEWQKIGVIFCGLDEALQKYPELVKKYFGTVVPISDNKIAALNTAVWSGGSFVYVPSGVQVTLPLQAYFRLNAANMGQFERTLIIAEEGSYVHYVEGCFVAGAQIRTISGEKNIEDIQASDQVLTHQGRYRSVYRTMRRNYKGLFN